MGSRKCGKVWKCTEMCTASTRGGWATSGVGCIYFHWRRNFQWEDSMAFILHFNVAITVRVVDPVLIVDINVGSVFVFAHDDTLARIELWVLWCIWALSRSGFGFSIALVVDGYGGVSHFGSWRGMDKFHWRVTHGHWYTKLADHFAVPFARLRERCVSHIMVATQEVVVDCARLSVLECRNSLPSSGPYRALWEL